MDNGGSHNLKCPLVCLNGEYLPEPEAVVPVTDRSFYYGDAVFETIRVYGGIPFAWDRHGERLRRGADILGLGLPSGEVLHEQALGLLQRQGCREAVLRIHVSRGSGPRGYLPRVDGPPLTLLSLSPAPPVSPIQPRDVSLVTVGYRLPVGRALADCKSANRLLQILASMEAVKAGADEALMLNTGGEVAEAASANLFWLTEDGLATPPLDSGALNGITRAVVMEIAVSMGLRVQECSLSRADCEHIPVAFLTSSVLEIQRVKRLDGRELQQSPLVDRLQARYRELVETACRR